MTEDTQSHKVMRQMPVQAGPDTASDETVGTLHEHPDTGAAKQLTGSGGLLEGAMTRQNLQAAWKRLKVNKGASGVGGLDIKQTAQVIRQRLPDGDRSADPSRPDASAATPDRPDLQRTQPRVSSGQTGH